MPQYRISISKFIPTNALHDVRFVTLFEIELSHPVPESLT